MKTVAIWKYPLSREREQTITVGAGMQVRHFGLQQGTPTIWAEVYAKDDWRNRITVVRRATGEEWDSRNDDEHDLPRWFYLGTIQEGPLVWHYYWRFEN